MKTLAIPLLVVAVGVVLFARTAREPRYLDARWRDSFAMESYSSPEEHERLSKDYWAKQEESTNPKTRYRETGLALITTGTAITLMLIAARGFSVRGPIQTPSTRRNWFAAANLAWALLVPAQWGWLIYTADRGDYPPWGDTLAIPMMSALFFGLAGLPVLNLVLWASLRGIAVPRPLLPSSHGWRGIIASVVFLPAFVVCAWALGGLVVEGDFYTAPLLACGLYLTLSTWVVAGSSRAA